MFCISCGSALPENATFCPVCGKKVTWEVKSEGSGLRQIRCSYCGSSNVIKTRAGEYRCEHCGTKFFTEEKKSEEENQKRDAEVAVLISEAQAYADKKNYQRELRTLAKAMEIDPENNTVLLRLGRAYWRLGLPEKAIEYYRIAEELYPDDPIVYTNIGAAYIRLGHYAEAKVQYEKGMSIIESNPMSACADDIAITYGNYALCLGKLGDKDGAKEYLTLAKEKGYSKDSINSVCKQVHLNRFTI